MLGLPPEISTWLIGQGPAGIIILILIGVIIYLFRRWDADREARVAEGAQYAAKYAEIALASAKTIEAANTNATSMIGAVQTVKLLSEIERRHS